MTDHAEDILTAVETLGEIAVTLRDLGEGMRSREVEAIGMTLAEAAEEMRRLQHLVQPLPASMGDVDDLPKELLDQLNAARLDDLEEKVIAVINAFGGRADLDHILVGLYRKFAVVQKRRYLQNRLYRLCRRRLLIKATDQSDTYESIRAPRDNPAAARRGVEVEDLDDHEGVYVVVDP